MIVTNKKGDYFISLPKPLYLELKAVCNNNQSISFGLCALLLNLILTNRYKDKNYKEEKNWVNLHAGMLRANYDTEDYKCKQHLEFLESMGIIKIKSHYHDPKGLKSKTRGYKINPKYISSEILIYEEFKVVEIEERGLKSKVKKLIEKRKHKANSKVPHLIKWLFSDGFNFDVEKAINFVNSKYALSKYNFKKQKRLFYIRHFETMLQQYSMEGKDERLHSFFTSVPSDLKQFISFNKQHIKEADIRSSQPLILSILLERIIKQYENEIERKGSITVKHFTNKIYKEIINLIDINNNEILDIYTMCYNITSIVLKNIKCTEKQCINYFIFSIRNGDIYEEVGEKLFNEGAIWFENEMYCVMLKEKDSNYQKKFEFETLRKCAKTVTLNAIYCSPKTRSVKAVNGFRRIFPVVIKWLDTLKQGKYQNLAVLMQQIESKAVLHYCAKKISEKHPEMMLISRHDSLSTTKDKFSILKQDFQYLLSDYFGLKIDIGEEDW